MCYEISGFHDGEDDNVVLPGFGAVWTRMCYFNTSPGSALEECILQKAPFWKNIDMCPFHSHAFSCPASEPYSAGTVYLQVFEK
jgi:hypothetical protein